MDLIAAGAARKGIPWLVHLLMLNPIYDLFAMYRIVLLPSAISEMTVDISRYYPVWLVVSQTVVFSVLLFVAAYRMFLRREVDLVDLI